ADGSPWQPKRHDTICSEHFIGGKKSDAVASPSYVPTIFPSIYRCKKINHSQVTARYNRFMTRRYPDQQFFGKYEQNQLPIETVTKVIKREFTMMADKGCQADIYNQFQLKEATFICNRYVQNNNCDAEIQVEIPTISKIVTTNTPKTKDIGCCTTKVTYSTQSTSTSSQDFVGISSIKNDQQLLDLAAYGDTQAIIDCTEFRIEVPSAVDHCVACYLHYKKGFTAKVVIGITPGRLMF
ncbi:hypothetical protein HF086_000299, partial [Spodoptera exigua]